MKLVRREIYLPLVFFTVLMSFGWMGFFNERSRDNRDIRDGLIDDARMLISLLDAQLDARITAIEILAQDPARLARGDFRPVERAYPDFRWGAVYTSTGELRILVPERNTQAGPVSPTVFGDTVKILGPLESETGLESFNLIVPAADEHWLVVNFDLSEFYRGAFSNQVSDQYLHCHALNGVILKLNNAHELSAFGDARHTARFESKRFGATWTLDLCPDPEFIARKQSSPFSIMPLLGTILALVVAWFIRIFIQKSEQIRETHLRMQESEQKFRTIFESSPIAILRYDMSGAVTDWNPSAGQMFSMVAKDFENLNLLENDGLRENGNPVKESLAGRQGSYEGPCIICEESHFLYVSAMFLPILTPQEQVVGGIAVIEDVTKRHRSEKLQTALYRIADNTNRLEDINDLFKTIQNGLSEVIDASNIYIALYDRKEEMISFPFYQDEFDNQPEPIKAGKGLTEFIIHNAKPLLLSKAEILQLAEDGEISIQGTPAEQWLGSPLVVDGEVIGVLAVQSYRDADNYETDHLEMMNFVSDQVARAIKQKQDQTEIYESEQRYRGLSEELLVSNNMKELLLDIITHDLKNPAGVIFSLSEITREEYPDVEELTVINDSSASLLAVIENATALAQVTLGEQIQTEDLDLTLMLNKTADEFEPLFSSAGKQLRREVSDKLIIQGNKILSETIANYLSNAIKYSPDEDIITLAAWTDDNQTRIEVRDNGATIPAEDRESIFMRKLQLEAGQGKGRGLGLAIVKRIAEAHGGTAGVQGAGDSGNAFYINIPLK